MLSVGLYVLIPLVAGVATRLRLTRGIFALAYARSSACWSRCR